MVENIIYASCVVITNEQLIHLLVLLGWYSRFLCPFFQACHSIDAIDFPIQNFTLASASCFPAMLNSQRVSCKVVPPQLQEWFINHRNP